MLRNILVVVLLVAVAATAMAGDFISIGCGTIVTPKFGVGTSAAVIMGAIPAGVSKVTVLAINGDINWGPATVASGVYVPYIASGSTREFTDLGVRAPKIYFIGRTGSATACLSGY